MVAPNKWEFQASVWEAAQPQLKLRQQHSEAKNEGGSEETPSSPLLNGSKPIPHFHNEGGSEEIPPSPLLHSGESIQYFQYTDLPHPGWEVIVSSTKTSYVPDGGAMMVRSPDVNPEGSHLSLRRVVSDDPSMNRRPQPGISMTTFRYSAF